jgi:transposase
MQRSKILSSKKIDGRKLSHEESEYIRYQAVKAVRKDNKSPEEVIETFGLHRTNIYKWLRKYDEGGFTALKSNKAKGPTPRLTDRQLDRLSSILLKNPIQLKFEYALWTVDMVGELIASKFNVLYSKVQVFRILKKIGFTNQRPIERAYQQDPERVKEWLSKTFPAIQKEAKRQNREIYFADEAGFHATAQYGKTWAPKGETPILKTTGKREKVNCISAINNNGKMRFMLYEEKFTGAVFIEFLKRLMHNQTRAITLVIDGHRSHLTKKVKEYMASLDGKLKIYTLPPYSPEMNPDELVWNNAKQEVAKKKYTPSKKTFKEKVNGVMKEIQRNKKLVASFFYEANVAYAR